MNVTVQNNAKLISLIIIAISSVIVLEHIFFLFYPFVTIPMFGECEIYKKGGGQCLFQNHIFGLCYYLNKYESFYILNVIGVLGQLSLFFVPPFFLFRKFFGLKTLIYMVIIIASWRAYLYSFSFFQMVNYILLIPISIILYCFLERLVCHWGFCKKNVISGTCVFYTMLILITALIGFYVTPRFVLIIISGLLWVALQYLDHIRLKLNRKAIFLSIIVAGFALVLSYWFATKIVKFDLLSGGLNIFFHDFGDKLWVIFYAAKGMYGAFEGTSPLLPFLIITICVFKVKNTRMNRIFFYIYIILIFIHIPDVLGMTIKQSDILRSPWVKIYAMIKYSSYASILIMIGVVSLRKPYRKGAVSFLFITFSIIFFAHFFLVKLSSFRNASHLPYIYMILAILASSLNIDSYTNVFNNYEYKIRYIFGFLIIVLLIFVGEGIYDTQRVYLSQLKANKENCIGWKNLVSILDQVPEINVFNGREVAGWRANYGLHFLMGLKRNAFVEDEVAYSSSNVSDKDYIYANNFLEYYSFYDSPYYPAYQRHPGLYVCLDIDDIYSYIYKLEKIGVAERIAILNNDTRNHRILSKGSYYFIIPSQNLSNSHKDIVINDKKHSYEIRFFKHCKDYSVYLCNVNNKQVEVNLSRLIHSLKWQHKGSKDFIIMKKANYSPLARYRQEFYRKSPVASLYSTLSFPFLQSVYFENISSDH